MKKILITVGIGLVAIALVGISESLWNYKQILGDTLYNELRYMSNFFEIPVESIIVMCLIFILFALTVLIVVPWLEVKNENKEKPERVK